MSPVTARDPIQWGIVGPGNIAHKFARDLQLVHGARLQAVAGRDLTRARAFADGFGAKSAYDDLAALAADPAVDMVYLAVPHSGHFAAAKLLLQAGKPLLCEKPLTVNAAQARELVALAEANHVLLMEAMWTRFLPLYAQLRDWLAQGRIGQPRIVASSFCFQAPPDPNNRFFNPLLAGGGLLDLGVYNLAVTQMVMGRQPAEVLATARMAPTGVDEVLTASLKYPDGGMAQFVCGVGTHFDNSLVIGGTAGSIQVAGRFIDATEAILTTVGADPETVHHPLRGEGFVYQIEEAMRCHRAGAIETPLMPHADTVATMETMDTIRRQIGLRYPFEESPS